MEPASRADSRCRRETGTDDMNESGPINASTCITPSVPGKAGDDEMGYTLMDRVLKSTRYKGAHKALLVAIARYVNEKTGEKAFPSGRTLAAFIGRGESTTWRMLGELEDDGAVIRLKTGGGRDSNTYDLDLKVIEVELSHHEIAAISPRDSSYPISTENGAPIYSYERNGKEYRAGAEAPLSFIADPGSKKKPKSKKATNAYTADFERAWALYPRRPQGDSKPDAFKAWNARIAEGRPPAELIAGVERYAAYIKKLATQFIQQASTFFGRGEHWAQPWNVPAAGVRNGTPPPATGPRLRTRAEIIAEDAERDRHERETAARRG
jgi:hypothetical protein